ncbi:MAG: aminopeptidase [Salinivirgaceae bacterium]|nr:aminopeptidase [Salinivirgaceae bacterium]
MKIKNFLLLIFILPTIAFAQEEKKDSLVYQINDVVNLKATSVKDQYRSGTCWAFSGLSFIESELLRMGKGEHDLAEMWLVKKDYHERAVDYVRWQGAKNFGGGAESNNVFDRIAQAGIMPEENFPGLNYGEKKHVHGELDLLLDAYVNAVIKNKNRKLTDAWIHGFDGILDAYLGVDIEKFTYNEKEYTPISFRDEMNIVATDYIEIGSFTHHPFYTEFIIEVPDNWSLGTVHNVPLNEMLETAYYALDHGYTILWGSDVSEKGFSHKTGVAIVPEDDIKEMLGSEQDKWEKLSEKERNKQLYKFEEIVQEKVITQEIRQEAFDKYQTTDDHGMHITGYATDQNGTKYFKVKNSWNTENPYDGYFYASESWFLYKTLSIMIHKDAIPKGIKKKLNIK